MTAGRPTLLVVIGPTASGKSALAHEIALERGGEIVSADAFAVYRGLDVGTAKPSTEERREVVHHMIDVADPREPFSAGRWANEARPIVDDVARRGRLPIVCGGSGFYVSALLDGLPPGEARDPELRRSLVAWARGRGPDAAHRFLARNDPVSARNIPPTNLRYTLRALEILLTTGAAASARRREGRDWSVHFRVIKIGLRPPAAQLHVRIEDRVRAMLEGGWDREVRGLLESGVGIESNSFAAVGYREVARWVLGRISRREAEEQIVIATRRLAKRQMTWFARERDVRWVRPEEALASTRALLDESADTIRDAAEGERR